MVRRQHQHCRDTTGQQAPLPHATPARSGWLGLDEVERMPQSIHLHAVGRSANMSPENMGENIIEKRNRCIDEIYNIYVCICMTDDGLCMWCCVGQLYAVRAGVVCCCSSPSFFSRLWCCVFYRCSRAREHLTHQLVRQPPTCVTCACT